MARADDAIGAYHRPVELLRRLIQFDTTNPPGNECECITLINRLLTEAGISTKFFAKTAERPNLIARLPGRGTAPPLLLEGHVDVVSTVGQTWAHPPFAAEIVDGWLWGRGTLDNKSGVAMMLAALLRARAEELVPAGDIIFAALADEEQGSVYGAKYLVENHPDVFAGVHYAIGEFGAFTLHIGGRRVYPIMIAEKRRVVVRAAFRSGQAVYGALPDSDSAMARMGRALVAIETGRLPVHVTPGAHLAFGEMARALGFPQNLILRQLTNHHLADVVLGLMGPLGQPFDPLLHNTARPKIRASDGVDATPEQAVIRIECFVLPGLTDAVLLEELCDLIGKNAELTVMESEPISGDPDMGLFDTLADILRRADPGSKPLPYVFPSLTDGRFLARLGIQTYGFEPLLLPKGYDFWHYAHVADERIPVAAMEFGVNAIYQLLQRYGA